MRWIFLLLFSAISLGACTKKSAVPSPALVEQGQVADRIKSPKRVVQAYNPDLEEVILLLGEAESFYKEALKVAGFLSSEQSTFFYKLQRAVGRLHGVRISNQLVMGCEKYKFDVVPEKLNWNRLQVFEICLQKPVFLLDLQIQKLNNQIKSAKLMVKTEPLQKLIGLGASLAASEFYCDFVLTERRIREMNCRNLAQQKLSGSHILKIDRFQFKKDQEKVQAQILGQVFDNLMPLRKFEMKIPLTGKIKITETELFPPEDLEVSEPAQVAAPPAVNADGGGSREGGPMGVRSSLSGAPGGSAQAPGSQPGAASGVAKPGGAPQVIPGSQRPVGLEFGPQGEEVAPEEEVGSAEEVEDATEAGENSEEEMNSEDDEASEEQAPDQVSPPAGGVIAPPQAPGSSR
ncbi:MAG: hypothetical protein ACLGGX_06275 [Bdellovibrionia bacterium]